MLRVEIAPAEAVEAPGGERAHEPWRGLGRRPRCAVEEMALRHLGAHEAGADHEDRDASLERVAQCLAVPADGRLRRRIAGLGRTGQVGGAAAHDHDTAGAALEHPWNDGAAAEVHAEHVHLEDTPPLARLDLPRDL